MRVLVTRNAEQAGGTAAKLTEQGHEAEILPLAEIRALPNEIPAGPFDAIVFTSGYAPRLLVKRLARGEASEALLRLPVWCVGEATARAANEAGFSLVHEGAGDAQRMAEQLAEALPVESRLLYPCGKNVAFDLPAALAPRHTEPVAVYEAVLCDPGEPALTAALERCRDGAALLYSERTASHFVELMDRYGLGGLLECLTLIAISEKTAEAARGRSGVRVIVAEGSDEASMFSRLAQL